jgi:hypothetical protein
VTKKSGCRYHEENWNGLRSELMASLAAMPLCMYKSATIRFLDNAMIDRNDLIEIQRRFDVTADLSKEWFQHYSDELAKYGEDRYDDFEVL